MPSPVYQASPVLIEGIGPAYGAALEAAGIRTILDMLRAGPAAVKRAAPRAPVAEVRRWFWAALLLQVDGVTPDLAEALVAAGVLSVERMAGAGLRTLERAVSAAHDARRLKEKPSLYKLAGIQRDAAALRGKGVAYGRVLDMETGAPLEGAVVRAAGRKDVTAADGAFLLTRVPEGRVRLRVESPGHLRATIGVDVRPREYHRATTVRLPAAEPSDATALVEGDGKVIAWGRRRTVKLTARGLGEISDGAPFAVRRVLASGAVRLLGLRRSLAGRVIHADVVDVARDLLPQGTRLGDVLLHAGGAFTRASVTRRELARGVFEAAFGPQPLERTGRVIRPGPREGRERLGG